MMLFCGVIAYSIEKKSLENIISINIVFVMNQK